MISLALVAAVAFAQEQLSLPFTQGAAICAGSPFTEKKDGKYECKLDYGDHKTIAKFQIKNKKFEGPMLGYNPDGEPIWQGSYKNGLLDGEVKTDFKNGKPRKVERYRAGKKEGVSTYSNDENHLGVEMYKDDKRDGYLFTIRNGKLESVSDCRIGGENAKPEQCDSKIPPGYEKQWAEYSAGKKKEAAAEQASRNGHVERKNREGVVIERYDQKDARIYGKHEIFYDNGKPHIVTNEEGSVKKDLTEYFDDGAVKMKIVYEGNRGSFPTELEHNEFYQNGKPKLTMSRKFNSDRSWSGPYKTFFDNGQVQEEGTYSGGKFMQWGGGYRTRNGPVKYYDEKGHLLETRTYKEGKLDGPSKSVGVDDEKRQVIYEDIFKDDVLVSRTITDAKSKKKLEDLTYFPDGSTKSDKKY